MLLIICIDSDDDIGRRTGVEAPIVGRKEVEEIAMKFGTVDPEDSDLNALFEAMRVYDNEDREDKEVVILTGNSSSPKSADRVIAEQLDGLIEQYNPESAIIITDGAEDEGIIPVVESRLRIDGVNRTVVRQAENLENAYVVIKQLLRDPETRGTILIPLGIILLIYPVNLVFTFFEYPNAALGLATAALGIYFLVKGFDLDDVMDEYVDWAREGIYSGKVSMITYLVAVGLMIIGVVDGYRSIRLFTQNPETVPTTAVPLAMTFINGAVFWFTFALLISSVGRIFDEYIQSEEFNPAYLNGPFYILSMGLVFYGVSEFYYSGITEVGLAVIIVVSIAIGASSTAVFGGLGKTRPMDAGDEATVDEVS